MPDPELSVVVCTYNRADLLPGCLDSLAEQTLSAEQFEVIIVDNNSSDETPVLAERYCREHAHFRCVRETEQGLAHARNRGWREAAGRYVAYIDDDARAAPDWCGRILAAFESVSPSPAAVGGIIEPWFDSKRPAWFVDAFEIREWGEAPGFLQPPKAAQGFSGSNMAVPKTLLHEAGGFSPDYGVVAANARLGEDTEFFYRVYAENPRFWYDPAIRVKHYAPRANMRLAHQFSRARRAGMASMSMEKGQRKHPLLGQLFQILKLLVVEPARFLFVRSGRMKTRLGWFLRELGYAVGRLQVASWPVPNDAGRR